MAGLSVQAGESSQEDVVMKMSSATVGEQEKTPSVPAAEGQQADDENKVKFFHVYQFVLGD